MIRIPEIVNALMPLVGWRQSYDPSEAIDVTLLQSESGLYYQDVHPLMTLKNVMSVMPEDFFFQYPQWDLITCYKKGTKVRHKNIVWIALQDNIDKEPPASDFNNDFSNDFGGDYWRAYNFVSDYLTVQTQSAIAKTVQTFLQMKSLLRESKNLLERRSLFDGAGRISNTIENGQRLVGMEIVPAYSMGVTTKLERIGLQMTGATGKVTLYVFHSSQVDPFYTIEFDVVKGNGSMEWKDLKDIYLPYLGDTGAWYVVYNQADLPAGMEAVNVTKDWSREPCGTCNRGNLEAWRELTKYLMVSPFRVPALETFAEFPEIWDIEDNVYTNTYNYGLNMVLSVGCDLTDFIIKQRGIFATCLQRQLAVDVLRTLAMNPNVRVNRNQSNVSREEVLYEVDGNPQGRASGLGKELKEAYDALDLDTRGIDRICLTCLPTRVKYRTV
jgi:hypothetical protein